MQTVLRFFLVALIPFFLVVSCEDSKTMPKKDVDKDVISEVDNEVEPSEKDVEEVDDQMEEPDEFVDEIVVDENGELDDIQDEDEIPDVDNWVPVDMCDTNADCAWNYICDYFQIGRAHV